MVSAARAGGVREGRKRQGGLGEGKSMGKWGKMEGVVRRSGKVALTREHDMLHTQSRMNVNSHSDSIK